MKALEMKTADGRSVLIEVSPGVEPVVAPMGGGRVAGGGEATIRKLEELGEIIADVCKTLQDKVQGALVASKPKEITLEFGVKLVGEAGVPLVTKGTAEATFQVGVKWEFK